LFPKITLLGSFGFDARDLNDFGKSHAETYTFGPAISWAALDLGRVRQQIKGSHADADAALATYEKVVLLALEDAESSLTNYSTSLRRQEHLQGAARASAEAADLAHRRFDGGAADFLDVLDAERSRLTSESELARGQTDTATALIAVYKALGMGQGLIHGG
jgi:multidrug efflux system outer membrane protein